MNWMTVLADGSYVQTEYQQATGTFLTVLYDYHNHATGAPQMAATRPEADAQHDTIVDHQQAAQRRAAELVGDASDY